MLRRLQAGGVRLLLDPAMREGMVQAQAVVQSIIVVYGINTGFGKLASTRIASDPLAELRRNLVLSHSAA